MPRGWSCGAVPVTAHCQTPAGGVSAPEFARLPSGSRKSRASLLFAVVGSVAVGPHVLTLACEKAARDEAIDIIHGDPQLAVVLTPVVDADDVRMPQL